MRKATAFVSSLFLGAIASGTPAHAIEPGDVVVLDRANERVLAVNAVTGAVTTLSPLGGTNLLDAPISIAAQPSGEIVVLNGGTPQLVSIDPATGAQTDAAFGQPLDLGTNPGGIDMEQRAPASGALPTIYVASEGELIQVTRTTTSASASQLTAYPEQTVGLPVALSIRTPSTSDAEDLYPATSGDVIQYLGQAQETSILWPAPAGQITGVDIASALFIARRIESCPAETNGVYLYFANQFDFQPFAVGGDLSCAGAIAVNPPTSQVGTPTLYAIQDAAADAIVEVPLEAPEPTVLATPTGGAATPQLVDLAVYLPEPAAAVTGLGALFAVAGLARAKRRDQTAE